MKQFYCQTKRIFSVSLSDDELESLRETLIEKGLADDSMTDDDIVSLAVDFGGLDVEDCGYKYTEVYT